jgi:guanylate kinase
MKIERTGMLLILSGPSGAGKGTLGKMLLEQDDSFCFSVSATTRAPRPGEVPDVDYHFVDDRRFDELIGQNAFLEYATVHGNRYGTLRGDVENRLRHGQNVLLDIDVQGAAMVMGRMPEAVSVFILPPSFAELRRRLVGRGTETEEAVETRLRNAREEIRQVDLYQYAVVNDAAPEVSYLRLKAIVEAEKQRLSRCTLTLED